jgi:hypothetical protein
MRLSQSPAPTWFAAVLISLLACAPVDVAAYVNGGDPRSDLNSQKSALEQGGWRVTIVAKEIITPKSADSGKSAPVGGVIIANPENEVEYTRSVKQFVARAIADLPKEDAARFTPELRDKLVAIALERLKVSPDKPMTPATHEIGPFECKVGSLIVSKWWETNYAKQGKRTHGHQSFPMAYVGIKIKGSKTESPGSGSPQPKN